MSPYVTKRELLAVQVAWDELVSYLDTVGQEGELEQWADEPRSTTLQDAEMHLRYMLARHGLIEIVVKP